MHAHRRQPFQLLLPQRHPALQVLELLTHVNKRVKGHDEIQLPLEQLLDLYKAPGSSLLVRNFALVYVEMAFERASTEDKHKLVRPFPTDPTADVPLMYTKRTDGRVSDVMR